MLVEDVGQDKKEKVALCHLSKSSKKRKVLAAMYEALCLVQIGGRRTAGAGCHVRGAV